jgi:hypothetical protein
MIHPSQGQCLTLCQMRIKHVSPAIANDLRDLDISRTARNQYGAAYKASEAEDITGTVGIAAALWVYAARAGPRGC